MRTIKQVISLQEADYLPVNVETMVRQISRVIENVSSTLQNTDPNQDKQEVLLYVFGHVDSIAAGAVMAALLSVHEMNSNGIKRMERLISVLKHNFRMMFAQKDFGYQNNQVFEPVKQYLWLLQQTPEELLSFASENIDKYSVNQWRNLFKIQIPGRSLYKKHHVQLEAMLSTEIKNTRSSIELPSLKRLSFLNKQRKN
eukprot:TRINITY_DN8587_c2_g1_i6.p2 TRINITY_DN8587_c2_g1~~TRINITY_DN8587_c2_g1_i6.p2  ORF type:complete len:199 (+),score=19.33 TRINITY_DN8587_c2_g1_i6:66-662(+)